MRLYYIANSDIYKPYQPGYKAMALFLIQSYPYSYNEYKAIAL